MQIYVSTVHATVIVTGSLYYNDRSVPVVSLRIYRRRFSGNFNTKIQGDIKIQELAFLPGMPVVYTGSDMFTGIVLPVACSKISRHPVWRL